MKVFLSSKANRQLNKLPESTRKLILIKIQLLVESKTGLNIKKLINRDGLRLRIGDYRAIYIVNKTQKEITILSIAHRKHAYKN